MEGFEPANVDSGNCAEMPLKLTAEFGLPSERLGSRDFAAFLATKGEVWMCARGGRKRTQNAGAQFPVCAWTIEFRRIGRKIQKRDVVRNDEVARAMVGRAVENQQNACRTNLRASTSRKAWKLAVFEVGMIK
jgi:hypothetical protein